MSMPAINFTADFGRSLQNLSAAFQKAQKAAAISTAAKLDVEFINTQAKIEHFVREQARNAPEDGEQFSETVGGFFETEANNFLERVPQQLRPRYAKQFAVYQNDLESRTYNFEVKLHDNATKRKAEDLVRLAESLTLANPGDFKKTQKQLEQQIAAMPLPEQSKAVLRQEVRRRVQETALRADAFDTPVDLWLEKLHGPEGTGKNPLSSANGHWQFIKSTWLGLVQKYAPKLAATLPPKQLLALRHNRPFAKQMARHYAKELIARMHSIGAPVNGTNLRLMWIFGPGEGARVLNAPDNAPVTSLVSRQTFKANPWLQKYPTVGALRRWAGKQMGDSMVDPYPDVAPNVKAALLSARAQADVTAAATEAALVQNQWTATLPTVAHSLAAAAPLEAHRKLQSLIDSGQITHANAILVQKELEGLRKIAFAEAERQAVIAQINGKDPSPILDKLTKQGAPAEVLRRVQTAAKSAEKSQLDATMSSLAARVSVGDPRVGDELRSALKDPKSKLPKDAVRKLLRQVEKKDFIEARRWRDEVLSHLQRGAIGYDDLQWLQEHRFSTPDFIEKAAKIARRVASVKKKKSEEEQTAVIERVAQRVEQGQLSVEEAISLVVQEGVPNTIALRGKLRSAADVAKKANEAKLAQAVLEQKVQMGLPLDPKADKEVLNNAYIQSGAVGALLSGDMGAIEKTFVPLVQRTKALPPDSIPHIVGLLRSPSPEKFAIGVNVLSEIERVAPGTFNQLPEGIKYDWEAARTMLEMGADPKTEVFEAVKAAREERARGTFKTIQAAAKEIVDERDLAYMFKLIDLDPDDLDPIAAKRNGVLFETMYKGAFQQLYPYYKDATTTDRAVASMMKRVWGTWESRHNVPGWFSSTGERAMLLPPSMVYPPGPGGSYEWLDKQLDKVAAEHNGERVVLVADTTSLREWRSGHPVTYQAYITFDNGLVMPLNRRFRPNPAEAFKEAREQAEAVHRRMLEEQQMLDEFVAP